MRAKETVVSHFVVQRAVFTVACVPCGPCHSLIYAYRVRIWGIVQELCESRGGRPGLSVLTSLLVSVDVKNY